MASIRSTLEATTSRWIRRRFAFPLVAVLAAALLFVSEQTYQATTATLRGGIELTDARIQSLGLLQKLAEAETAHLYFVATGDPAHLVRLEAAKRELPALLASVTGYFGDLDKSGAASAERVRALAGEVTAQFDRTLQNEQAGDHAAAVASLNDYGGRQMSALRAELSRQLANAAALQMRARTSIYDALFVNRVAVGSLTLIALLGLFLFQRQLKVLDQERDTHWNGLMQERSRLEAEVERRTHKLAELTTHLQTVREDERSVLARELHDELGSLLTASKLEIARARSKIAIPTAALERLDRVVAHINGAIALKRRIIEDLRPSALSNLGLMVSLEILCKESSETMGIPINFSPKELRLTESGELTVYRFVQEALTNSAKYAEATAIDVMVESDEREATISVRDDGGGFDLGRSRVGHHGLAGMSFRAESLGGSMSIASAPGAGTALKITLPLLSPVLDAL